MKAAIFKCKPKRNTFPECLTRLLLVSLDGRCEKPDISADEHLSIEPNQAIYTNGSFITYICQVGYQLIGEPSAMCNNGHFQPADIPYCQGKIF